MASSPIDVKPNHFDGGSGILPSQRSATDKARDLASILRNAAEEFSDLHQSGGAVIAGTTQELVVSFSPAMPSTAYDVVVTLRGTPEAALAGPVDLKSLFVPEADKTASGFKVKVAPATNVVAGGLPFTWYARHRSGRLITKG